MTSFKCCFLTIWTLGMKLPYLWKTFGRSARTALPPGDVSIVEDRPDRVSLSARFSGTGFIVLADQFYP